MKTRKMHGKSSGKIKRRIIVVLCVLAAGIIILAVGFTVYTYRKSAIFLPGILGVGDYTNVKEDEYYDSDGKFRMATENDRMRFFMGHPVFGGYKHMFFNAEDNVLNGIAISKYSSFMKAQGRPEQTESSLEAFNYLIQQVEDGNARLISDIYPQSEIEEDPYKGHLTGMFYQGKEDKPLAVVVPGGGFISNVTDCEGYPIAKELHERGYSVLVVSYPVGNQLGQTDMQKRGEEACLHLVQVVKYLNEHQEELHVDMDDYAVFGFSAGGMMTTSLAFSNYPDNSLNPDLPRPNVIFPMYGLDWNVEPAPQDRGLAVFSIVGTDDPYGFSDINEKIPALEENLGKENVSIQILDNLEHGFGLGKGTVAENWIQDAVDFWEEHR